MAKKTLSSIPFLTAAQALEKLWSRIDHSLVKAELEKWYALASTEQASGLYQFNREQLAEFLDHLPDLLLILYAQSEEVQKGGHHES